MKGIVYNTALSTLNRQLECFALRIGYLICDSVVSAGNTNIGIFIKESDFKNRTIKQKIELLEKNHKNDPELLENIAHFKQATKNYNATKHKPGNLIALFKKLEQAMLAVYDEWSQKIIQSITNTGLPELKELVDDQVFSIYEQNEEPEIKVTDRVIASDVLQLSLPGKEEGPELFILTPEFFYHDFSGELLFFTPDDKNAEDPKQICLCECFIIPNLNFLLHTELRALRKQFSSVFENFRKVADEWLKICYGEEDNDAPISFLREKVIPAAETVQQQLQENPVLKHYKAMQFNGMNIEVSIALVPVEILWKYHKHFNVISEPTWQILQPLLDTDARFKKRWPVIIYNREGLGTITDNLQDIKEEGVILPPPVKKSISVD